MIKKAITLGVTALLTASLFSGCKPKTENVAPEPDMETTTSLDASWATFMITDVDMICAFLGENDLNPKFYMQIPGTENPVLGTGTVTPSRNPGQSINIAFNKSKCLDGHERDGTIFMDFKYDPLNNPGANPNSQYYHEYGYAGRISLINYYVDGWKIDEYDEKFPGYLYNELTGNKTGQYRWRIAGKYRFTHPTDTTKNMVWDGKLYKTLVNFDKPSVLSYTRSVVITWTNSIVSYSGDVDGRTNVLRNPQADPLDMSADLSGGVPFKFSVGVNNQLVRDFSCYPDKVGGIKLDPGTGGTFTMTPRYEEYHPFVSGIASFTTGSKYPRQIYYGNEGNPDLTSQCDNTGEVLIKGISYRVNFRK